MLPLLRDKTLYLSLSNENCCWLKSVNKLDYQSGNFLIEELESQVSSLIHSKKFHCHSIDITIDSHMCRFVVLPPLKKWPEKEILDFLLQQKFQQKYLDFNSSNFIILHDKIKFNQPCVAVAFPKNIYERVLSLQTYVKIKSLMPSILTVWNYYEKKLNKSNLLIIESNIVYAVEYNNGIIKDIDIFPRHLKLSLNYDDIFVMPDESGEKCNNLYLKLPYKWQIKQEQYFGKILNFMRMSSHG